jgi:hypothetical protein
LHKEIKEKYFRIGHVLFSALHDAIFMAFPHRHMGVSVVNPERGDVDKLVTSMKDVISAALKNKSDSKL